MSATNRYINWTAVGFTPSGGSLTAINGVTSVSFDENGAPEMFKGDGDVFCSVIAVPEQTRTAEVDSGDAGALDTVTVGTVGVLVAKLNDALNKVATSGGGKLYTLSNAVLVDKPRSGSHGKFASAKYKFAAFATDGTTDPLVITAL